MKEVDVVDLFHEIDEVSNMEDVKKCLFSFLSLWLEIYELENEKRRAHCPI